MTRLLARRGTMAAVKPFDPATLGTINEWWKADALGLANNDPVPAWASSKSGGTSLVQATGANQPLFKTNIQNGLPGVLFDGVNDYMTATIANLATSSVFMVASILASSGDQELWMMGGELYHTSGNLSMWIGSAGPAAAVSIPMATSLLGAIFANPSSLRRNGTQIAGTSGAVSSSGTSLNLGRHSGAGRYLNGYLHEVVRYSGVLSTDDNATLEAGLRAKWGTP